MIIANDVDRFTPQFRVLSDAQCEQLYRSALECLQRVGVKMGYEGARNVLAAAGATVSGDIVRIPSHLVQQAVAATPPSFKLWGRDQKYEMEVAPDRVSFGPGPTCTYYIDPYTGQRRKAQRGDAGLTARVCDALQNIDYIMGLSLFDDVTSVLSPVYEYAESVANTTKPILAWAFNRETLEDIYRMAVAVAGDEGEFQKHPIFGYFTTYESPFRLNREGLENMYWAAERRIPVIYLGGPTFGLESPFSSASALVIYLATVLAGITAVQLKHPGAAMAVGGVPSAMDLRTARPAYGSPEMSLHVAAAADLSRFLKIPFMGTAGASESKLVDAQAGLEASIQILMSALSGAGMVHDMGFLDCADIGSLEYLVLVDEIVGMVKRIMRGIVVDTETIMLDLIEKVGPGGNFMVEERSASRCRQEVWIPTILDRTAYTIWEEKGAKETAVRVREKLAKIISSHQPTPLSDNAQTAIDDILNRAQDRENKKA